MQARAVQLFLEQGVFFKPRPEHREIVQFVKLADMKPCAAHVVRQVIQKVDQFTFARSRAAIQDQNGKNIYSSTGPNSLNKF